MLEMSKATGCFFLYFFQSEKKISKEGIHFLFMALHLKKKFYLQLDIYIFIQETDIFF